MSQIDSVLQPILDGCEELERHYLSRPFLQHIATLDVGRFRGFAHENERWLTVAERIRERVKELAIQMAASDLGKEDRVLARQRIAECQKRLTFVRNDPLHSSLDGIRMALV